MNAIELVKTLERHLNIPDNQHIIAVFENDDSEKVIGYVVTEIGKEGEVTVLTAKELIEKYG